MEELANMIFEFFAKFGWQLGLCAIGGIFVLGILKCFGIFKAIKSDDLRKFLYIATSCILSLISCVVYLSVIHQFNWVVLGAIFIPVFALNQAVYQLYETMGVRKVWGKFLALIAKLFVGLKTSYIKSLGSDKLRELAKEIDEKEIEDKNKKGKNEDNNQATIIIS